MEILGKELEEILNEENDNFELIDKRYKFHGCDHDLWEFQAIVKEVLSGKFFSVNWYDTYNSWWECGLTEDMFELTEVFPKETLAVIYE